MQNTTNQVFVLNGNPCSGKNTFCEILNDIIPTLHYSYVDFTRYMLDTVKIDYSEKTEKTRKFLEGVNDCLEQYADIPFKDICDITNDFLNGEIENCRLLFIDIRKPENIKRFVEKFKGARTIYVEDNKPTSTVTLSDSLVKEFNYDFYIINESGLDQLKNNTIRFIENAGLNLLPVPSERR